MFIFVFNKQIWAFPDMIQAGNVNVMHPLPILWDINLDKTNFFRLKIMYSIKILQCILQKYESDIDFKSSKSFNLHSLF